MDLVIDSSSVRTGVAFLEAGRVVAEAVHESGRTLDLAGAVRALGDPRQVERVAVATGPGSFTGLRVGASYAAGLALGLRVPLLAFSTLDLQRTRARAEATGAAEAGRGRVYVLTPEGERALVEAAAVPDRWPVAGWLRDSTRAQLRAPVLAEPDLLTFGQAAAVVVERAPEVDCARVTLEYMQSFERLS